MEKVDFRVQVSRKVLQDSLLALMKEKSILHISIKEICEFAGLSRSTFYAYYKDEYDLLQAIEEQTLIEANAIALKYKMTAGKPNSQEITVILQDILQLIVNNSNSIQVLWSENGDSDFQKKFFRKGIERMSQFRESVGTKSRDKEADKYDFAFVIGGMFTIVQEWLKNGMDIPAPKLAKILAKYMGG
ncbi:MAG: TetR/AcrR family transcriptional regulator [Prevotellaceae bacterium]|jgi:AcrR family transcriptional regulator|nr:TetR/AcrR family transcriptional regulator [Prevotellaceae bacterium]